VEVNGSFKGIKLGIGFVSDSDLRHAGFSFSRRALASGNDTHQITPILGARGTRLMRSIGLDDLKRVAQFESSAGRPAFTKPSEK
jgi:hypothetical protein